MGVTVACVLRSGGWCRPDDVARLRYGVAQHLDDHEFVCLSDVDVPCERIALQHGWPGWWSKIELFRLPPPVLFFDLDTMIVGDLAEIADKSEQWQFTMLRDFYRETGLGSGVMGWGVPMDALYAKFVEDPEGWMKKCGGAGDQCFIELNVNPSGVHRWQDELPGQVVSYKAHVRKARLRLDAGDGTVPKGARVICFHGHPKPRDIGWTL